MSISSLVIYRVIHQTGTEGSLPYRGHMTIIRRADFPADTAAVLDIWREYVASPSVSLDYQGNQAEFATLPGKYEPPTGCILLAQQGVRIVGCIAYRAAGAGRC